MVVWSWHLFITALMQRGWIVERGAAAIAQVTGLSAQNPAVQSPVPSATRSPESQKSTVSQTILGMLLTAGLCSAGSLAFVTQPLAE